MPNACPPTLSIVIPTRNTKDLTLRCLDTLHEPSNGQESSRLEVIVVDDGSDDGTLQSITERFPQVVSLRTNQNQGFSASANRGLHRARGSVFLLLNSDTELPAGSLEALFRAAQDLEPRQILGAQLFYPNGDPQWSGGSFPSRWWLAALAGGFADWGFWRLIRRRIRTSGHREMSHQQRNLGWVTGAAMAFSSETWAQFGPLDESFDFYAQDLDFCYRVHQGGGKVAILPDFRVLHHLGASIGERTVSARLDFLWSDLLLWVEKAYGPSRRRSWARTMRWAATLRLLLLRWQGGRESADYHRIREARKVLH